MWCTIRIHKRLLLNQPSPRSPRKEFDQCGAKDAEANTFNPMKVTTPIAKFEIDKFENPLGKRQQDAKNALSRRRTLITNPYEILGKAEANSNVESVKTSSTRQSMSFIRNPANSKNVSCPSGNTHMNLQNASSTAVDKPLLMAMQSQRQKLEAKRRKKKKSKSIRISWRVDGGFL